MKWWTESFKNAIIAGLAQNKNAPADGHSWDKVEQD
jgi:hypothetical protein